MGQTRSSLSSNPAPPPTPSKRHSKRADPDHDSSSSSFSTHSDSSNPTNTATNGDAAPGSAKSPSSSKSKSKRTTVGSTPSASPAGNAPQTPGTPPAASRDGDDGTVTVATTNTSASTSTETSHNDTRTSTDTQTTHDSLPTIAVTTTTTSSTFYNPWEPLPTLLPPSASQFMDQMEKTSNFNQHELDRLRKRFMKLDSDGSGSIDREEFLQIPQIANNPLASRMIAIFDDDGGGTVDFQEFVGGLSAFSSRGGREEKLRFAFKVYDIDRDGYISNGELFLVLKMMVGNNLKDTQLQQIVDKTIMEADKDGDGKLSFEEFTQMVAKTDIVKQMTLEDLF